MGLVLAIFLLIPNIIYALKVKNRRCTNRFMNVLEQIGRYGYVFMVFNIGIAE